MGYIRKFNLPFFRYLLVGASTALFDLILFWILINVFKLYYLVAQIINGPIIILYNYLGHKIFTFNHPNHQPIRYIILVIFNYFVGLLLIYFYVDLIKLPPIIGKIFTIGTFVFYNYFALKKLVFKE